MALTVTHTSNGATVWEIVTAPFRAIGRGLVSMGENNPRYLEAQRLHAMTDEELAARNLKRDDIVKYVYRDLMHI